jgi:putative transposase
MQRSRFTGQQLAFAMPLAEPGTQVGGVTGKMGISGPTFDCGKKKFGGLMPSEVRKLRQLGQEKAHLPRLRQRQNLQPAGVAVEVGQAVPVGGRLP